MAERIEDPRYDPLEFSPITVFVALNLTLVGGMGGVSLSKAVLPILRSFFREKRECRRDLRGTLSWPAEWSEMPTVPVPEMKTVVIDAPEGLILKIPPLRSILSLMFMPLWLVGWGVGEVFVVREVLAGRGSWFLNLWLVGWKIGGILTVVEVLWILAGEEKVTVDYTHLVMSREVLGLGRRSEYTLSSLRTLAVSVGPTIVASSPWACGRTDWAAA